MLVHAQLFDSLSQSYNPTKTIKQFDRMIIMNQFSFIHTVNNIHLHRQELHKNKPQCEQELKSELRFEPDSHIKIRSNPI